MILCFLTFNVATVSMRTELAKDGEMHNNEQARNNGDFANADKQSPRLAQRKLNSLDVQMKKKPSQTFLPARSKNRRRQPSIRPSIYAAIHLSPLCCHGNKVS